MVLIGALGIFLSAYSLWVMGKLGTAWLRTFLTFCCGFRFAAALLWVGWGFDRNEILDNRSAPLWAWLPKIWH
jgi:hypothetical protein